MPQLRSRRTPSTTPEQSTQIRRLEPVYARFGLNPEPRIIARPCAVTMKDGTLHERAYMVESRTRFIHPSSLDIRDVADIRESPHRLPADLARKLYEYGETSMGGQRYSIEFEDGSVIHCVNNAWNCDYPDLPDGYTMTKVKAIHVPADKTIAKLRLDHKCPSVYFWYHDQPRQSFRRFMRSVWQFMTTP